MKPPEYLFNPAVTGLASKINQEQTDLFRRMSANNEGSQKMLDPHEAVVRMPLQDAQQLLQTIKESGYKSPVEMIIPFPLDPKTSGGADRIFKRRNVYDIIAGKLDAKVEYADPVRSKEPRQTVADGNVLIKDLSLKLDGGMIYVIVNDPNSPQARAGRTEVEQLDQIYIKNQQIKIKLTNDSRFDAYTINVQQRILAKRLNDLNDTLQENNIVTTSAPLITYRVNLTDRSVIPMTPGNQRLALEAIMRQTFQPNTNSVIKQTNVDPPAYFIPTQFEQLFLLLQPSQDNRADSSYPTISYDVKIAVIPTHWSHWKNNYLQAADSQEIASTGLSSMFPFASGQDT